MKLDGFPVVFCGLCPFYLWYSLGPADISVLVSASHCTPNALVTWVTQPLLSDSPGSAPSFLGTSLPPTGWDSTPPYLNKSFPPAPPDPLPSGLNWWITQAQRRQKEGASPRVACFCPPGSPRYGAVEDLGSPCLCSTVCHILQAWESSHRPLFFLISLTRRPAPARKQLNSQPIGSGQRGDRDMHRAHRFRGTEHLCSSCSGTQSLGVPFHKPGCSSYPKQHPGLLGSRLGWAKTLLHGVEKLPWQPKSTGAQDTGPFPLSVSPFLFWPSNLKMEKQ